jgi:hypothetical protein
MMPRERRTLSCEACPRLTVVRSIFFGAVRERRFPTVLLTKVVKSSQQVVARVMTRGGGWEMTAMTAKMTTLDEGKEEADEVFGKEDIAQASWAEEVELNAGTVHAQGVVGENGDAEDGVGDRQRQDVVSEAFAGAHAACEEEDHEDGNDKTIELVDVATEVEELLLQAGDDGVVEPEDAGVGCSDGGRA